MKYAQFLTTSAILASTITASPAAAPGLQLRADPDDLMIFLCDQMPEVCTNMCYGAYCEDIGEGLKYDKPDSKEKRNRRKQAGCIASGGNRCSVKKGHASGYQCDEYPFASTTPSGGSSKRLNRCVPAAENRKQGGIINAFYQGSYCKGGPCTFTAKFSNAGNIDVCTPGSTDACNKAKGDEEIGPGGSAGDGDTAEDGTDDDGGNPEYQGKRSARVLHPRYRTSSGLEIDVPGGARIGQRAVTVLPRNATLWDEQANNHVYDPDDEDGEFDYMLANLDVRDDTIVAAID